MTQFVACKFRPSDAKTFTYANDGDPVEVGDTVRIGIGAMLEDGTFAAYRRVEVAGIVEQPAFDCKPIFGKAEPREDQAAA